MIPYTLFRSQRKTIAIHITWEAAVEVRAPLHMPKAEIDRFVASKERWISSHLALREQQNAEQAAFTLAYGAPLLLRGTTYPIAAREGRYAGFDGTCFYMPPGLSSEDLRRAAVRIYQSCAKRILTAKTAAFADRMGVTPSAVKINGAKSRWGSCSSQNSINFSWRLVMAEDSVIDYVVVHELAHIREHNHAPSFWAVVEGVLPDYRQRRETLKELQNRLARETW